MKPRPLLSALVLSVLAHLSLSAARITSAQPGNLFTPDAPLAFTFEPTDASVASSPVVATLRDFGNRVLATRELRDNTVTFPAAAIGFYRLEIGPANAPALAAATLGVLPARVPTEPDATARFGTIAHLKNLDDEQRDRMLDLISRAGIGWIREGFLWHELEPSPGDWRTSRYDDLVERSLRHGVQVLPVLAFGTPWAATDGTGLPRNLLRLSAPRLDAWETYVRQMVTRYGDRLHAWEIWNEPNLPSYWKPAPDANAYAKIAGRAFATIKEHGPDDTVLTAGFSPEKADRPDLPAYDEGVFVRALAALTPRPFDVLGYHPYTVFRHGVTPAQTETLFQNNFSNLLAGLEGSPAAPVWITEVGVSTIDRITTEEDAAGHLAVLLTLASARADVRKVFLYNFRDAGTDPLEKEHGFGLLHYDYTPKPGYFAYRTFIARLGRATFVHRTERHGVVCHEFATPDGRTVQVLWSANAQPVTTRLSLPAATVERVNVVGDSTRLPVTNGRLTLEVTASPIYLDFNRRP